MQIETVKDVLHWTREFHHYLSQCLSHCKSKNTSERARMVLDYLSDHETKLQNVIAGFETSGNEHALNTWCIEYLEKQPIVQHVHCEQPFSKLDAEQIMDAVVDQHCQVIELYRYLATRVEIPVAKELMETLLSVEEYEIKRLVQSTNRFNDI